MGSYDYEQQLIAEGKAERGYTVERYFEEVDAKLTGAEADLVHHPNYSRTLLAPENDDIYREFCAYVDQTEPRSYNAIENPLCIEGFTAQQMYEAMEAKNERGVALDAANVYNMLVKLRNEPQVIKSVLVFERPRFD